MVERRQLTPEVVHLASPPECGEKWIADTKVQGFGLRLWATRSGGNKAFAVRVADVDGKLVRKTFDTKKSWRTDIHFRLGVRENDYGLGDYLDDARDWARDEIDRARARPTRYEQAWIEHRVVGGYVKRIALGDAAQSLICGMRANGRSQRYVDRLDKLFANNISAKLKTTPLHRVSAKSMAWCLVNVKQPAGNIRILRSFVSQVFERGADFHGPLGRFRDELSVEFHKQWEKKYDVRYPELRKLKDRHYRAIFERLESEEVLWQQALCIRLFFEFQAPLSRVLYGCWHQIDGEYWYPYWPDEKVYWYECRERIEDTERTILNVIADRSKREVHPSSYWFPTRSGGNRCISSVDLMWRKTLIDCRMPHYPLREFARSYRNPNCPSYYINFLREYGELIREAGNVAELSKSLIAKRKNVNNQ